MTLDDIVDFAENAVPIDEDLQTCALIGCGGRFLPATTKKYCSRLCANVSGELGRAHRAEAVAAIR